MREVIDTKTELISAADPEWSQPAETEDKDWGQALTALVSANQDVIVKCPWMGGAEVTLGAAMTAYDWPPNLTAQDEPFLIAVVHELLSSQVRDTEEDSEEPAEEDEPEEERRAENEDNIVKQQPEKPAEPRVKEVQSKQEDPKPHQPPQTPKAKLDSPPQPPPSTKTPKLSTNDPTQSLSLKPQITSATVLKTIEKKPTLKPEASLPIKPPEPAEKVAIAINAERDLNTEPSAARLDAAASLVIENTPATNLEQPQDDLDTVESVIETIEPTPNSILEISEDFPEEELILDQPLPIELETGEETLLLKEEIAEEALGAEEIWLTESADLEPIDLQPETPSDQAEISLAFAEIADCLEQISEAADSAELELDDALAEIVEKTIELTKINDNEVELIEAAEAELEELWIGLLEKARIDYTPELLESLMTLAVQVYEQKPVGKSDDEAEMSPPDYGTHEVINNLLTGLCSLQQAAAAYIIGKSAIELYSQNAYLMSPA